MASTALKQRQQDLLAYGAAQLTRSLKINNFAFKYKAILAIRQHVSNKQAEWNNALVSICIWYPLINESSMAQTQT